MPAKNKRNPRKGWQSLLIKELASISETVSFLKNIVAHLICFGVKGRASLGLFPALSCGADVAGSLTNQKFTVCF